MDGTAYRLVVKGELGARYRRAFTGMTVVAADGETVISGQIIDRSHLRGLLERIDNLGLEIVAVTPGPEPPEVAS